MSNNIETPHGEIKKDWEEELKNIPDVSRRKNIAEKIKQLGSTVDINSKEASALIEDYIKLNEERYLDQRGIFQDENGKGFVHNKNYIKTYTKNLIAEGKTNFSRIALDVEGLKTVNDLMGHDKGDKYLKAVYEKLNEAITVMQEKISEEYGEEVKDKFEFIISVEGGDEFGVMIVAPENAEFKVSDRVLNFSEQGNEQSALNLPEMTTAVFNEKLDEVDCSAFIDNKKIETKYLDSLNSVSDGHKRRVSEASSAEDSIFTELANKFSDIIEASGRNIDEMDLSERKTFFAELVAKNNEERSKEIERKFKDYKFFASASAGIVEFDQENWIDQEALTEKTRELVGEKSANSDEASSWAKADMFFNSADTMEAARGLNSNKKLFKKNLFEAGHVKAESDKEQQEWQNLATHSEVLSRNEEMSELIRDFQKVMSENDQLKNELKNTKQNLRLCLDSKK